MNDAQGSMLGNQARLEGNRRGANKNVKSESAQHTLSKSFKQTLKLEDCPGERILIQRLTDLQSKTLWPRPSLGI